MSLLWRFLKNHTKILTPNQLLHTNCLLHSNNRKKSWQFKHKASSKRFDLYIEPSCKADSSLLLAEMAAQGLGICHLPSFTVEPYLRSSRLVSILDEWMPEPLDIYVVYPDKPSYSNCEIVSPSLTWLTDIAQSKHLASLVLHLMHNQLNLRFIIAITNHQQQPINTGCCK